MRDQARRSLAADTGCIQNATAAVSQGPSATAASQQAQAAVPTHATRAATARKAAAAAARGYTGGLGAEFAWAARYHGFHEEHERLSGLAEPLRGSQTDMQSCWNCLPLLSLSSSSHKMAQDLTSRLKVYNESMQTLAYTHTSVEAQDPA